MKRIPKPGEFYRHFQGKLYQIITVAEHVQTGEVLVICQELSGSYPVYAEPVSAFHAAVDRERYPQTHQQYCFELADIALENKAENHEKRPLAVRSTSKREIPYVPEDGYLDDESDMEDDGVFGDSFEEVVFDDDFVEDMPGFTGDVPIVERKVSAVEREAPAARKDTPAQWLERFLDAEGYEKQLEVLNQMRGKVGMKELGSICMVLDVPLIAKDEDSQISMIMRHLETRMRYDGRRLR